MKPAIVVCPVDGQHHHIHNTPAGRICGKCLTDHNQEI